MLGNAAFLGRKHSSETKEKMRLSHLGRKYKKMSELGRLNIKNAKKPITDDTREKMRKAKLGKTATISTRLKMSLAHRGDKSYNWKGGKASIASKIRKSFEYKLWREAVFKRDNWTCVWCGRRGRRLNADHIKPFAYYPELRFAIDNGRTLCVDCHKTTDTYLNRWKK